MKSCNRAVRAFTFVLYGPEIADGPPSFVLAIIANRRASAR
jgi:hypothetical protein